MSNLIKRCIYLFVLSFGVTQAQEQDPTIPQVMLSSRNYKPIWECLQTMANNHLERLANPIPEVARILRFYSPFGVTRDRTGVMAQAKIINGAGRERLYYLFLKTAPGSLWRSTSLGLGRRPQAPNEIEAAFVFRTDRMNPLAEIHMQDDGAGPRKVYLRFDVSGCFLF